MEGRKPPDTLETSIFDNGSSEEDKKPSPLAEGADNPRQHHRDESADESEDGGSSQQVSLQSANEAKGSDTSSVPLVAAANESDEIAARKRMMNIIYSRRKRAKKKRLVEDLKQNKEDLERKNSALRSENANLERVLLGATAHVAQIEAAALQQSQLQSHLVGTSLLQTQFDPRRRHLQDIAASQSLLPSSHAGTQLGSLAYLTRLNHLSQPLAGNLLTDARSQAPHNPIAELAALQNHQSLAVLALQREALIRRQQQDLLAAVHGHTSSLAPAPGALTGSISNEYLLSRLLGAQESSDCPSKRLGDQGSSDGKKSE